MQAQEFVLSLHAGHDPADLRSCITDGMSRLIACDRTTFNEVDLSLDLRYVVPTPTPGWWPKFGEVFRTHMLDHPSLSRDPPPPLLRTVALDDAQYAPAWRKSALWHEYFLPLDVTHQVSSRIHGDGDQRVIISLNRHQRGFSRKDRALIELLNPHLAQAWRTALLFAGLRDALARAEADPDSGLAAIAVDPKRGTMRSLSPSASHLLRQYFARDCSSGARLPRELSRWMQAQQPALPTTPPSAPLVLRQPRRRLTISLARHRPDEAVLLLRDCRDAPVRSAPPIDGLSGRENEILSWIIEGKRNSEIAVILSISQRTVEKHVEHILDKMSVETRSAAIRQAAELRSRHRD